MFMSQKKAFSNFQESSKILAWNLHNTYSSSYYILQRFIFKQPQFLLLKRSFRTAFSTLTSFLLFKNILDHTTWCSYYMYVTPDTCFFLYYSSLCYKYWPLSDISFNINRHVSYVLKCTCLNYIT